MDRETWMALSNEVEPALKRLKQIAEEYNLTECLSVAVFAGDEAWIVYNEFATDTADGKDHQYKAEIDENNVFSVSDKTTSFIKE